jgi:hypothetical protein
VLSTIVGEDITASPVSKAHLSSPGETPCARPVPTTSDPTTPAAVAESTPRRDTCESVHRSVSGLVSSVSVVSSVPSVRRVCGLESGYDIVRMGASWSADAGTLDRRTRYDHCCRSNLFPAVEKEWRCGQSVTGSGTDRGSYYRLHVRTDIRHIEAEVLSIRYDRQCQLYRLGRSFSHSSGRSTSSGAGIHT